MVGHGAAPESLAERRHLVSFLVMVAAGLALATVGVKSPERLTPLERTGLSLTSPLSGVGAWLADAARSAWSGLSATREAHRELGAARTEIRDLRLLLGSRAELAAENARLRRILELREGVRWRSVPAFVVDRERSPDCVLVIDRGAEDGVRDDAPVVSPDGVVGKVVAVTARSAMVQCVADPDAGVAVLVGVGRDQADAVVTDASAGTCRLRYLDFMAEVRPGDVVVTSGRDRVYPKGLLVGTVVSVEAAVGVEGQREVTVEPAVDFRRLEEVLVLLPDDAASAAAEPAPARHAGRGSP
jgi:rod shape-determining protein MreC